ncbi:hypothetical protein [Alteromonas sp. a30]|uniref:hypothetical protein n=1 Tax=Alteromonas sp. a30 TaxID=2730917 RepID=UPI00227E2A7D|nr:hypothetical protein [Alteromonas sp. a30]MCY7296524.1 hypothetical protein [Alteromonas sp. a30]
MTDQHSPSPQADALQRDNIKAKFADNQRPTGADFAEFIDASVIQQDDGLQLDAMSATLTKPLMVMGSVSLALPESGENVALTLPNNTQLSADALQLGESVMLSAQHFSVGEKLQFDAESGLNLFEHFTVNASNNMSDTVSATGRVSIAHTDALLHVDGSSQFTGTMEATQGYFSEMLSVGFGQSAAVSFKVNGESELFGGLRVSGDSSVEGALYIGSGHDAAPALLSLSQIDGGDLLHIASDSLPVVVDQKGRLGLGHEKPLNSLDVNGSVAISATTKALDLEYSLVVDNRIGVGTRAPQSRLDVLCESHQDAFTIRQNEASILSIRSGMDNSHANFTFSGDTHLYGKFSVDEKAHLNETQVNGTLTATQTLEVKQGITGRDNLHIDGDSVLAGDLTLKGEATLQDGMQVAKTSTLHELDVLGQTSMKGDVHLHDSAHIEQTLSIATDTTLAPNASLHIKEDNRRAALRIDDNNGEASLLVNNHKMQVGTNNQNTDLALHGDATLKHNLMVEGQAHVKDGMKVQKGLKVEVAMETGDAMMPIGVPAMSRPLEVKHDNQALLVATQDKVGLLVSEPQSDIHLGGDVLVDDTLRVDGGFAVRTPEQAGSDVMSVSDDAIVLDGRHLQQGVNIQGDTQIDGNLMVSDWLNVDARQMALQQKGSDAALIIRDTSEKNQLRLNAESLSINVEHAEANLHIKGTAKIDGNMDSQSARVKEQFTALKGANFESGLVARGAVCINAPINSPMSSGGDNDTQIDLHLRQSSSDSIAMRVDQSSLSSPTLYVKGDQIGVNTDTPDAHFAVQGNSNLHGQLTLSGHGQFNSSVGVESHLTVSGELQAHAPATFDKSVFIGDDEKSQGLLNVMGSAEISGETHVGANLIVEKQIGLGTDKPNAGIHIGAGEHQTAVRIEGDTADKTQFIVTQGRVGVGVHSPRSMFDVADDAYIGDALTVDGRVYLNSSLDVAQDTNIKSDLFVLEKSRLREQTILGVAKPEMIDIKSQLYIADTTYSEALRIDSEKFGSIVIKDGRIGVGVDDPSETLQVAGTAEISQTLSVGGNTHLQGEVEVEEKLVARGSLDVSKKSEFGSDVQIAGDLSVEDRASIDETLTVTGATYLNADLMVKDDAIIGSSLTVEASTSLQQKVDVGGALSVKDAIRSDKGIYASERLGVGVETATAAMHVQSHGEQMPLRVEHQAQGDVARSLMTLTSAGDLGLGVTSPSAKLDVKGGVIISGDINVMGEAKTGRLRNDGELSTASLSVQQQMQLGEGPVITGISDDVTLGGDAGVNALLPTQAAVKSYIDNVVVPFGRGGKTHTISSQIEFDRVFNKSSYEKSRITDNTTVILMPMNNQDNGTSAYQLTESVSIGSNVSIVGFNPHTTVIRKQNPRARFELVGSSSQWISNVKMDGFTFDGNNIHSTQNGGAFYLEYARDCELNCHIVRHRVSGHGGGIYASRMGANTYTANSIQALNIRQCHALEQASQPDNQRNEGGAAWGLTHSEIHADQCHADHGGAVAYCHDSRVRAMNCQALANGGGAYRCERLVMFARNCRAEALSGEATGKGGGAYYCSDLMCEGFWTGNNAAEGPHIYANNNLTDAHEERHYWRGDFVGRKIDAGEGVWRVHNE